MSFSKVLKDQVIKLQSQVAKNYVADDFIHLTEVFEQIGRYVLIRHMTNEFSDNYNEATQESLRGSKYKYEEYLVKAYSIPISEAKSTYSGLMQAVPQVFENIYYQYYFSNKCVNVNTNTIVDTIVKADDEIYELNYFGTELPTVVYTKKDIDIPNNKILPISKFRVKHLIPYKTSNGKIQYLVAITMKDITNG